MKSRQELRAAEGLFQPVMASEGGGAPGESVSFRQKEGPVNFSPMVQHLKEKEKRCVPFAFRLAWGYREPTVPGVHKHMDGATEFAVSALVNILTSLICITLSWWVLQNVRFDLFLREPGGIQGKALQVILAIVLGHGLATFFIDYMGWSGMIRQLF